MSTPVIPGRPELYTAARRFVEEGLRKDGSLFSPGRNVWRADVVDDFYERFVTQSDFGGERFDVKLQRQLTYADPDVAQFVAELLFVYCLAADRMKARTVEDLIETALSAVPGTSPIPADLRPALA